LDEVAPFSCRGKVAELLDGSGIARITVGDLRQAFLWDVESPVAGVRLSPGDEEVAIDDFGGLWDGRKNANWWKLERKKTVVELEEKRWLVGQPHMDRHDKCRRGLEFGWAERYLGAAEDPNPVGHHPPKQAICEPPSTFSRAVLLIIPPGTRALRSSAIAQP
jgi:hypothetical protein